MRHARMPCVTIAIDSMTFRQPVHLGELLVCSATVTWVGRTSIEVGVTVHAENPVSGEISHTNSAFVVYVALGDDRRPTAAPPLLLVDDDARRHFEEGAEQMRRSQDDADADRADGQNPERPGHDRRRLVRMMQRLMRAAELAEEDERHESPHVESGKEGAEEEEPPE